MTRWILRLILRPLKSDSRWLLPIILSTSVALASLVPVEALHSASDARFTHYSASVLGGDLRIEPGLLDPAVRPQLNGLVDWAVGQGAQAARIYEATVHMRKSASTDEIPIRLSIVVFPTELGNLGGENYPFYGGELWSKQPAIALQEGIALSTNATKNLGATIGEKVTLAGIDLMVAATVPENILTLATSGSGGTAVMSSAFLAISPEEIGAVETVIMKFPTDSEVGSQIYRHFEDVLGKEGLLGSNEVMSVVEVGLARIKQAFLWCGLLILFMCAFGLSFGVEDYMNSKSDEIATLKVLGFSHGLIGLILTLRLSVAGIAAGVLGVSLGWLMTAACGYVVRAEARSIAQMTRPSEVPWHLFVIGLVLIIIFGAVPLWLRLREKPHHVLWSKMRGFPLAVRTRTGMSSLLVTLFLSIPVMFGLARWYCGDGQVPSTGALAILLMGILSLGAVAGAIWIVSTVGRFFTRSSWAFTYLNMGRGRLVASTGAVAFALAIGSTTLLLDKAITWEVQAAVSRQVPFSVCALMPHGLLPLDEEATLSQELSLVRGVEDSAYCDVGWVYLPGNNRGILIKAVELDEAPRFGSLLGEYAPTAPSGVIPCTLWEERTRNSILGQNLTLTLGAVSSAEPQGRSLEVYIVALDPRPGLRVGLNAPITVPAGVLDIPVYRFLGLKVDPVYTFMVADFLRERLPEGSETFDFGPIEVMLRTAAEELSFVWRSVAYFALLVSIMTYLTTSSVSRLMRSYEVALLRTIGISGWRLRAGPYAEAITQGLISGTVGALVSYLIVYKGLALFINVDLPTNWSTAAAVLAVSVMTSVLLQMLTLRANLKRSPLEVLRSE